MTTLLGRFCLWRWLTVAAILSFFGSSVRAQVVNIPDPHLEAAIRTAINKPSGPITVADMQSMTNLSAVGWNISDLTGLEKATNLRLLDCGSNPLATVTPIAGLTNLQELHMAFCQVTNPAPVAGLTNLTLLDIGWNRDATDNSIRDTTFLTNLRKLKWLSLYYLRIHDLAPLAGLTSLTNLNFGFNYSVLNATALNNLTNMVELYVTGNGLYDINFVSHMPSLNKLDIGYNNTSDLSPALGRNLVALWAWSDPLSNPQLVTNFPALTVLHLDSDNLTNASYISKLPLLQDLSIDNNQGLSGLSFLSGLTNLTYLSIGNDSITNLPILAPLTRLAELHLHDNPGLISLTPLLGLTNLTHLDLNNCPAADSNGLGALRNLNWLELNNNGLSSASFVASLTNLNRLDINNDNFTSLDSLAGARLGEVYINYNPLFDISGLLALSNSLYHADVRYNLLDTNAASRAWNTITNLQNNGASLDYVPQNFSTNLTVWDSPADQCLPVGGNAYFAVSASTTTGTLRYQWAFNSSVLPGQTNFILLRNNVSSNQAGLYRAIVFDDNGGAISAPAHLYVGDTNCGRTIFIHQQPVNTCVSPGDSVQFSIAATTTLTNLYYQWRFNGVDISGETVSTLNLHTVSTNDAGLYHAVLWDDSSNLVTSADAELKVVDVVSFADAGLSNLVFQALGLSSGSSIHLTNLDNLTSLHVGGQGITNLAGLECARYLFDLDLSNDPITNANALGWLITLNYLYLDNCGLQDASFVSSLTNLTWLTLNNNRIHSIPEMNHVTGLNWLEINYNGCLVNIQRLAALTNLNHLALHDDCLPDIAFATGMPLLQLLDAGGDWVDDPNRSTIRDISPLSNKTQMNWLSISWDQVTNVQLVANLTNMTTLYLSSNHFSSLSFITNMPALSILSINYSQVTNLAPLTSHWPLQYLDAGYILTSNLTAVSGLTNLTTLWAGGNNAGSASMVSFLRQLQVLGFEGDGVTDPSPLAGLTNLYYLSFENNHIPTASAFAGRTNLQYLYLSGNQIHDLSPLAGLTNLQSLSLSANGFTNIAALAGLYRLNWLVMQSNHVQNVTALAGLTNLQSFLELSVNEITNMAPLTNLHILTGLGIWMNKLTSLPPLAGLSGLTSLDFWGNQLTNVSGVSGMTQLNWLGLSRNNLSVVLPLSGLPNLNTLDLYTNHITDVTALTNLPALHWLNLSDNDLQIIHSLTNLTSLNYLDVRYNRLDTNALSADMYDIAVLQSQSTYVDYIPQKTGIGPQILITYPLVPSANHFQFTISSPAGSVLRVLTSTNLVNWTPGVFLTNTTGTMSFVDSAATDSRKFYWLQLQ